MTPLVLIGCGYIGTALAKAALSRERVVHALVRTQEKADALRSIGLASVVATDVAGDAWHDVLPCGGVDVVYSVSSGGGDDEAYRRAYAGGMASALRWASHCKINTFVYTSSTGVYPQSGGVTVDESFDVGGDKRSDILVETERLLLDAAGKKGSGIARGFALRLGGLYGPGRHYMLDALRRGETKFAGRGDFRVNYLHRDDAVSAIFSALNADAKNTGGVYNITDGNPAVKEEITAWLAHRLGMTAPVFDEAVVTARAARRGVGSPDRIVSNEAFRRDFGWTPTYPDFKSGYESITAG
jgi:nucleoside-diphosphate-sugar epimerase